MKTNKFKQKLTTGLVAVSMLFALGMQATSVNALGNEDSTSESVTRLQEDVYSDVQGNVYRTPKGDGIKGSDILNKDGEVSDKFDELKEGDKTKFLQDVDKSANNKRKKDEEKVNAGDAPTNTVTQGTVNAYWDKLKDKGSVASRMIVVATADVQPDFQGASLLLRPFTPYINTGMAVFIILASLAFFFFLAVDIFFFMTPPFQYMVLNGGGDGAAKWMGYFVSARAQASLKETQDKGNPLIKYIGKSWIQMAAYAVVLLFFASNAMLTLVGPVSNLVANLVGMN